MSRRARLLAIAFLVPLIAVSTAVADPKPAKQKLAVIGAGSFGGTVGRLWVEAGHEVMFSSRHPEELEAMARRLGARASVGTAAEAAAFGELLPGTRYVRVFSAVDASSISSSAKRTSNKLGVPLASADADALRVASQLVRDAGSDPVVVGGLAAARGFQRGGAGFVADTTAPKLRRLLKLPTGMLTIVRAGTQPSRPGPDANFTGEVRVDPLFSPTAPRARRPRTSRSSPVRVPRGTRIRSVRPSLSPMGWAASSGGAAPCRSCARGMSCGPHQTSCTGTAPHQPPR